MVEIGVTKGLALQFNTVTWTRCSFCLPTVSCERFGSMSSAEHTENAIVLPGCCSPIISWCPSPQRWPAGGMGSEVFSDQPRQSYQFKLSRFSCQLTQRIHPHAEQGMLTRPHVPAALKAGKNKKGWMPLCLQREYRRTAEGGRALPRGDQQRLPRLASPGGFYPAPASSREAGLLSLP